MIDKHEAERRRWRDMLQRQGQSGSAPTESEAAMLSDDEILDIATAAGLRFSMYSDDVETRAAIKRLARAVERAAYERAKQACMEIGKEIVCPEECAAAIDALGGSDGN